MTTKRKTYKYTMTLTESIWPRKLADILSFVPELQDILVSIKDNQNKTHVYGGVYKISTKYTECLDCTKEAFCTWVDEVKDWICEDCIINYEN